MNTIKSTEIPKISVIIPVYNCSQYLEEALVSLIIQTYKNFEIIAVNDGSTDDSLMILEKFAKIDNRIKIITQKNSGIVKALNNGIKAAKAEYIARMDGDDVSFPNRLADQVAILDSKPNVILVAGDFEVINQASEFLYREIVVPDNIFINRAFYLRNAIAHGSVMFRKSAFEKVGGYSDKCGPTEDLDLWMKLSKIGEFSATGTSLYKWRVNQSGLTMTNNGESRKQAKIHIDNRWQEGWPEYIKRSDIIKTTNKYFIASEKYGIQYKHLFLVDTGQIAVKFFTHGDKIKGIKQLFAVASIGRTGSKIAFERLEYIIKARIKK